MSDFSKLITVSALAIVVILAIEITALYKGVNGTGLAASLAGVGAITGYSLKAFIEKIKRGNHAQEEKKSPAKKT